MFEKFAESARLAVFFARYEALTSSSSHIQPYHLAVAIRHLCPEMPWPPQIDALSLPYGSSAARKDIPFSEGSRRVLQNAVDFARALWKSDEARRRILQWFAAAGEWRVDTRHILMALMQEQGAPAEVLQVRLFGPEAVAPKVSLPSGIPDALTAKLTSKLNGALLFARYEATRFSSGLIGPKHLLAGMVCGLTFFGAPRAAGEPLGSMALLRHEISTLPQPAEGAPGNLTPDAQRGLRYAEEEAGLLGHDSLGTSHLLLGLLRTEDSFPAAYLKRYGIELPAARTSLAGVDLPY